MFSMLSMRSADDLTAQARIRDTAIDVFARDGFGASVRAIAQDAGVSPGLVIHHFGSKGKLRQACDDRVREIVRHAKTTSAALGGPAGLLQQLAYLDDYRSVAIYLVRALSHGGDLARHLVAGLVEDAVQYLRAGVESGRITPAADEAARARCLATEALGGLVFYMNVLSDEFPSDPAAAFDRYAREMTGPLLELYSVPLFTSTELLDDYRAQHPAD